MTNITIKPVLGTYIYPYGILNKNNLISSDDKINTSKIMSPNNGLYPAAKDYAQALDIASLVAHDKRRLLDMSSNGLSEPKKEIK
jgi:hypothetical protein